MGAAFRADDALDGACDGNGGAALVSGAGSTEGTALGSGLAEAGATPTGGR